MLVKRADRHTTLGSIASAPNPYRILRAPAYPGHPPP